MYPTKPSGTKIVIATGLALFAMFFGAGNIVFPLYLGANAGQNIVATMIGFLLAGVCVPFLGLFATSLYQGNYHAFFMRLGKMPGFILICFLMIVIGPLAAMPRTETVTFNTLLPYVPDFLRNNAVFSLFYCGLVFVLAYRETKVVEILGLFLSPVKIVSFSCLVFVGVWYATPPIVSSVSPMAAFQESVSLGYNTMDLLATFFYCTVAFNAIQLAVKNDLSLNPTTLTLKASVLGGIVISLVYAGFMIVAYNHASVLQGLAAEQTITAISHAVLGKFGGFFVCIAVSFACLATTLALAQVSNHFLYTEIFKRKVSKHLCLTIVMLLTYLMSNLDFQGILKLSLPIVHVIYPALIVLCIFNILYKWKGVEMVKMPVLLAVLISLGFTLYSFSI